MQTAKWGGPGWCFLHGIPMCYPEELTVKQADEIIEFLELLKDILPCKYCRASYADFLVELPPREFIEQPPAGYRPRSRLALSRWLHEIHNKVNDKLEKPRDQDFLKSCCRLAGMGKLDAQTVRRQWCNALWDFLFTVAWNYIREPWRETALRRLFELLPRVLAGCPAGKQLQECLSKTPLSEQALESLDNMKQWIYQLRSGCAAACGEPSSFEEIDVLYESWRSGTCNERDPLKKKSKRSLERC